MAIVKSNICDMCGGLLDIDIDRQVYICPFCGVTFDYEYFRKDNVLDIAKKALNRHEFGSAKDAFDYMLKKDPHNFEALRGLILCRCKWTSFRPMHNDKDVFIQSTEPTLSNAVENCLPEHKEYFIMIREALDVLYSYRKGKSELAKLSSDLSVNKNALIDLSNAQAVNRTRFTAAVVNIFETLILDDGRSFIPLIFYFAILILFGLGYATVAGEQYWIPVAVAAVITLVIVIYNVRKSFVNKAIEAAKTPVKTNIEALNQKIDALTQDTNDLIREYKKMAVKIITTYPIDEEEEPDVKVSESQPKAPRKSSDFPSSSRMH